MTAIKCHIHKNENPLQRIKNMRYCSFSFKKVNIENVLYLLHIPFNALDNLFDTQLVQF